MYEYQRFHKVHKPRKRLSYKVAGYAIAVAMALFVGTQVAIWHIILGG